MASTRNDGVLPVSYYADTDLSAKQYFFAAAASTADYVKLATGACNPRHIGVLQDDDGASAGVATSVKPFGYTKVAADASSSAISVRNLLAVSKHGRAIKAGACATCTAVGIALEALSSGCAIIAAYVWPTGIASSGYTT